MSDSPSSLLNWKVDDSDDDCDQLYVVSVGSMAAPMTLTMACEPDTVVVNDSHTTHHDDRDCAGSHSVFHSFCPGGSVSGFLPSTISGSKRRRVRKDDVPQKSETLSLCSFAVPFLTRIWFSKNN